MKMDYKEKQEVVSPSTLPVLSRLDRLDRLLLLLEEGHCLSTKQSVIIERMKAEDQCKTLASALEEVHHKGTLMERLTMLENRVLEMSLVMEQVENTARPSTCSCTLQMAEKNENKSSFSTITNIQDEDTINNLQGTTNLVEACASDRKSKGYQKERRWRNVALSRHKKWIGWFRMGC